MQPNKPINFHCPHDRVLLLHSKLNNFGSEHECVRTILILQDISIHEQVIFYPSSIAYKKIISNFSECVQALSILNIIFRQVDPEKNKTLADSQSKETQIENMRTVKVNAQVTAMISFSEIVGFLMISIICISAQSATIGVILFPLLQNIILPYAFLMNTRENKHRIVEQGWANVLRNTLHKETIFSMFNNSNKVKQINKKQHEKELDIFVVSRNVQNTVTSPVFQNEALTECSVNVVMYDKPCTSNSINDIDNKDTNSEEVLHSSSNSGEESVKSETVNLTYRQGLLNNLLQNTDEESVYLSFFTRLIHFEQDHNMEKTQDEDFTIFHQEMIKDKASRLLIKGNRRYRMEKRKDIIKTLQNFVINESQYQETFQKFLTMEEEFLDDER